MEPRQRIVVVGGGFGGINLISRLDKKKFDITLVDCHNYHCFPPLFYQVASGGLEPGSISFPFRREIRRPRARGVRYHMGLVTSIDYDRRVLHTSDGSLNYDLLVIAAGTTNNFFGNPELIDTVYTLKSTPEAIRCRDSTLRRLEQAANATDAAERRRLLSFAVIGGGPTGVEIAGALGEVKRYVIPREYPELNPDEMTVTLLEGQDRLLGAMHPESGAKALTYLQRLMVDVRLSTLMKSYDADKSLLTLSDGSTLEGGMVIWTAGVTARNFATDCAREPERGPGNRIIVDEFNRVPGFDGLFAIGDICVCPTPDAPRGYPQLAQVAIQQARLLADQLNKGEFKRPFRYRDKGTMATVGRNLAVVEIGSWRFGGRLAWLTWMLVHLLSLLGARNKLNVMINWVWAYFTFNSSLRLFFKLPRHPREGH